MGTRFLRFSDVSVRLNYLLMTLFSLWPLADAQADDPLQFQSSDRQAVLVELFSSQGCSSCPRAEAWLNALKVHKDVWKMVVPVSLHVDYWDHLGWKDPFASPAFTQRQYRYKETKRLGSIYTPCFVLNGKEWKGWFAGQKLPKEKSKAGILSATLQENRLEVRYSEKQEPLALHVAILGMGLETEIPRGENRDRRLKEGFVALNHQTYTAKEATWSIQLPKTLKHTAPRYALALWVCRPDELAPLQATGTWLPDDLFSSSADAEP